MGRYLTSIRRPAGIIATAAGWPTAAPMSPPAAAPPNVPIPAPFSLVLRAPPEQLLNARLNTRMTTVNNDLPYNVASNFLMFLVRPPYAKLRRLEGIPRRQLYDRAKHTPRMSRNRTMVFRLNSRWPKTTMRVRSFSCLGESRHRTDEVLEITQFKSLVTS